MAASEKYDIGLKLIEGKKALSFQAYKRLAEILFRSEKIEHISTHTFLVLEWNLIAQSENCVGSKVEHIYFRRDVLLFGFVNTNTDQEGINNTYHMWHVYANTLETFVCPLLALAWYIISHQSIITGKAN